MSENLDLVRSIYADWERGDFTRTDWAHRDLELVWPDGPSPSTWSGLAAAAVGWREFLSTWESYRVAAEKYLVPDGGRVLALVTFAARGRASGVEVADTWSRGANLFEIKGGVVHRLVLYWDRERALADLGVHGQAVSQENVEIVRGVFVAGNHGDPVAGKAAFDPMAERDMTGLSGWAEKDGYRGAVEIRPFLQGVGGLLAGVALRRRRGAQRRRGTGVRCAVDVGQRRIVRVRMFSNRIDALTAVGPEE